MESMAVIKNRNGCDKVRQYIKDAVSAIMGGVKIKMTSVIPDI